MIRIVLADDHHIVRQGVRALLEAEPGFAVVGEAATGAEALHLAEQLQPDILIVDLMMPGMTGLEVIRHIRERVPQIQIIMLSMYANESYVLEALRRGAAGYVLKEALTADLIRAVRESFSGRRYLSPPLSEHTLQAYLERVQRDSFDPYKALTSRERQVLRLVAQGYSSAEIALQLSISPRTAETHRANMMKKLNMHRQGDLIRYALRHGIVSLDS